MDSPRTPSTDDMFRRIDRLSTIKRTLSHRRDELQWKADQLAAYLVAAPAVERRLEILSDQLFGQLVAALEQNLSVALQEVLDQPLQFKVERTVKRQSVCLEFSVERDEQRENIIHGQGGSVANVLSVGLRFFALATLDELLHRRFIVLDEQDCWLRPDLVPRLVKIVHDAAESLGFQVLMISHHDISSFSSFADRIYQLVPTPDGVGAKLWESSPAHEDEWP